MKVGLYLLFALLWLLSRLPMRALYVLSDLLFPIIYHVTRYRRALVRRQLADSFPDQTPAWRRQVERQYYHFLCDYFVETVKLIDMSGAEIERRVTFEGLEELQAGMRKRGKQFALAYLGHYGNWEWVASFSRHLDADFCGSQIYHPLKNKMMDRFFIRLRRQFGGECVGMKDTLRHILGMRGQQKHEIIGFIADQAPKWEAMHHWTRFLHHDTSFFIGTEQIGKRVEACIVYVHVTRPRRGYYHCRVIPLAWEPRDYKDYDITDLYAHTLEAQIREQPWLWLWSHNRWKRTHEEWLRKRKNSTKDDL